jgi:hypothetical protein
VDLMTTPLLLINFAIVLIILFYQSFKFPSMKPLLIDASFSLCLILSYPDEINW